ncbi:caldesmon-like [Pyrus ussuriensis x Pyrus communis]|uniref:Caldesmon-like n=1 Tax=Pyrus ussuriensis x Pyrus communis TaxID=2448454 RepID=A0A5N5GV44_9ROSA|nr:caldesmon-like [Pyrus ussuriensis x Pyrus communis]
MAPRKRKLTAQEKEQVARVGAQLEALVARDTARGGSAQRVTRSLTQTAASGSSAEPRPVAPARKKAKGAQKKKEPAKKVKPDAEEAEGEAVKEEKENSVESEAEAEAENKNEKGKEKLEDKNVKGKEKLEDDGEATKHTGNEWDKRTIVIEHWQCKSFETRADEVKDSLEKGVPGIKVLLNPDKVYLLKDINVFHGFELIWMEI